MENKIKKNKLKEENGSVAVLVLITILAFLIVLTAFYFRSTYVRKSQLETDALLKNIYESQVNDEITQYSWKSYVQDGLILHYDGINNTGNGHSETTTTWKDLSGKGNDGTLNGTNYLADSGWKEKCLKMDGIDDWIDTGMAGTTFSPQDDFTMSIVVDFNAITNQGDDTISEETNNGDTGIILGGHGSYTGYGIYWVTYKDDSQNIYIGTGMRTEEEGVYSFSELKGIKKNEKVAITFVHSNTNNKIYIYINGQILHEATDIEAQDWGIELSNISLNAQDRIRENYRATYADLNLYSARIYNKSLTADEVAQNYKVDRQRFEV